LHSATKIGAFRPDCIRKTWVGHKQPVSYIQQQLSSPRRTRMNLISLEIRVLRSLLAVIESGSVTEAARRLGRTQPAITLQLQRLEELIGKPLFTHEGRRMSLTPDGETVVTYARSILRLHDELLARMLSPDIQGDVVLGTPDLYAAFMLPDILAVFRFRTSRSSCAARCRHRSSRWRRSGRSTLRSSRG
jgi:hypothetical protein